MKCCGLSNSARLGPSLPLPRVVQVFWAATLIFSGISVAVAAWAHWEGMPQTRWDGLSDPLLGDLMEYPATYRLLHSAAFFTNRSPGAIPSTMFSAVAYPLLLPRCWPRYIC